MWGTLVWWRSIGRFDWPTHDVWTGLVHIGCVRCKTTYLTCFGTMPKKTEHAWGSFFFLCGVCICSRVYNIPWFGAWSNGNHVVNTRGLDVQHARGQTKFACHHMFGHARSPQMVMFRWTRPGCPCRQKRKIGTRNWDVWCEFFRRSDRNWSLITYKSILV